MLVSLGQSLGQSLGTQNTISELEVVLRVKLNENGLTFCDKAYSEKSNNNNNKKGNRNSQRRQKSNFRNQGKPSGGKTDKTKRYTVPKTENFLDQNSVSYKPWTTEQKKNFAKLIEEYLV